MDIKQSFLNAAHNLFANKVRFVQCMLTLVVGVAGLITVLILGSTILNFSDLFFNYYTPGTFSCDVGQNAAYAKEVGLADIERLAADNPEVIAAVTPLVSPDSLITLRNEGRVYEEASLCGVNEDYLATYNGSFIQVGRFLQPMDIKREQRVCVLGKDIADALFEGDALGRELRIFGENYQVVGVLADLPPANFELYIPYTTAHKIFGERIDSYDSAEFYYDRYLFVANGEENMSEARRLLGDMLRRETGGETGSVYAFGTRWTLHTYGAGMVGETVKGGVYYYIYSWLLAVGLVLLISCAGIMNVMLASVQERTQEIGLRRAFGATNQDIRKQFTLESVATSLIGGGLGVALGLGLMVIMAATGAVIPIYGGYQVCFADMNWLTLSLPILAAVVICVGVGVLSAAYPAQQAVKMEIVTALNEN